MSWPWIFTLIGAGIFALAGGAVWLGAWTDEHTNSDGFGWRVVAGIIATLGVLVIAIGVPATAIDAAACRRYGQRLGLEVEWPLVGGCYVAVPGEDRMVPQSWIIPVIEGERLRIEISDGTAP